MGFIDVVRVTRRSSILLEPSTCPCRLLVFTQLVPCAFSLSGHSAAAVPGWAVRSALPYVRDFRASSKVHAWFEHATPVLDTLLHESLVHPDLARFERVRELPEPLPHVSWTEALRRYALARMRACGRLSDEDRRVVRELLGEFVHVVRIVARHRTACVTQLLAQPLLHGGASSEQCAQGFCDAALRADGRAALGVVLRAPDGTTLARIAAPVRAQDIVQAEARALVTALSCARALGLERLVLHTDASALAKLLNGQALPPYCVEEGQAEQLRARFAQLAVLKVPRLLLFEADRLAASALQTQGAAPFVGR